MWRKYRRKGSGGGEKVSGGDQLNTKEEETN
jgi:hypothetical protein